MTYSNVILGYAPASQRVSSNLQTSTANAALFQSMLQSQSLALRGSANSAFGSALGAGSVGTRAIIASPLQASTGTGGAAPASTSANIPKDWCISDYYKVPPDEVIPICLELREEMATADFTGMTDIEIYDYIENRYKDIFGEDFMMAVYLDVHVPTSGLPWDAACACNNYQYLCVEFQDALHRQFGEKYRDNEYGLTGNVFTVVNRERLYPGMSNEEIKDAIRAKYPPNDKLTNRDVYLMLAEMNFVGMHQHFPSDYKRLVCTPIGADGRRMDEPEGDELNRIWMEQLDKPINIRILNYINNNNVRSMLYWGDIEQCVIDEREFLIKYLGATVGADGFLQPDDWLDNASGSGLVANYKTAVPDLQDEFIKGLDSHYRKLAQMHKEKFADGYDREWKNSIYEKGLLSPNE